MKRISLLLFAFFAINLAFGQSPESFKYQAVIRDAGNLILANQNVGLELTIRQGSATGTSVYSETFSTTTNAYGLVNLEIGTGTTLDDFSLIDWSNGPYFIETAADLTGGTSYSTMGTSQLLSVPYALYANQAETVINDNVTDADADPTNEIQDITLTGTDLSISNGSTVDLSPIDTDTQIDSAGIVNLGFVAGPHTVDTDDQTLSLSGTDLTIDNGNTIDLSSIDTDTQLDSTDIANMGFVTDGADDLGNHTATQNIALDSNWISNDGDSEGIYVDTAGNVGMGTNDFTSNLTVYVDTNNAEILDANNGSSNIFSVDGGEFWQSFTAVNSGEISRIRLYFYATTTAINRTIKIFEGEGTSGNQIFQGTTQTISLGSGSEPYDFTIGGVDIVAGNTYTIRLNQQFKIVHHTSASTYTDGVSNLSGAGDAKFEVYIQQPTLFEVNSGGVYFGGTLVNTDDQSLSLSGTDLTIEDGNTVDLTTVQLDSTDIASLGFVAGPHTVDTDTDDQTLTLSGTSLSISEGNSVDLSQFSNTTPTYIEDADSDTKIQVEESADEDIVRIDLGGTEYFEFDEGRINVLNTGNSVYLGDQAGLNDDLSGNGSTFIGFQSGMSNTSGTFNTALGFAALSANTTGDYNIGIGYRAMNVQTSGQYNNSVGAFTLYNQTSGANYNNAFGGAALQDNTTGDDNTAIGDLTLSNNTTANKNTGVGSNALYSNTTGGLNTAIGYKAGYSTTTGLASTYIGAFAGQNNTGSNNVIIGYGTAANSTFSDQLWIDNSTTTSPLIYGEFDNNFLRVNGELDVEGNLHMSGNWISYDGDNEGIYVSADGYVGIGTNSPTNALFEVNGATTESLTNYTYVNNTNNNVIYTTNVNTRDVSIYATDRIIGLYVISMSDERIKDVQGLSNGSEDLATLNKIRITDYQYKDKVKRGDQWQKKVIAQQVAEVFPQAVDTTNTEIVPDIYAMAEAKAGWISIESDVKAGDRVKLLCQESSKVHTVIEANENGFRVEDDVEGQVFVYGREVDNFHTVDYDAISMLNVSATQELYKKLVQLEEENSKLKGEVSANNKALSQIEERLNRLEETSNVVSDNQ